MARVPHRTLTRNKHQKAVPGDDRAVSIFPLETRRGEFQELRMIVVIIIELLEKGAARVRNSDVHLGACRRAFVQTKIDDARERGTQIANRLFAVIHDDQLRWAVGLLSKAT
jgi:hypothetical protein